ncbi:unnamed protein product [Lymnaea stagnalis]|uniref:C-type lectin domain-containing protein n=1 Tax=Lymnaea stagnalis TaxID=6523 RepID=A0AAV2IQZ2_LYMST
MCLISFQMLLFFLNGVQFTVGQVTITTTPTVIESEITKSLVVTCRFPPQSSSGYQVFSLALKKLTANSTLEQLASINRDTHSTVHIDVPSYGMSSSNGVINSTLGSFLTLEWVNPMASESGTYQCKANVFNEADDIFVFNENKSVSFTQPSVGSLTHLIFKLESEVNNKLQRLEKDFSNITTQANQTNNTLEKMQNDFNNITAQSNQTNNKLQKLEKEFNNLTAQSTQFNNKLQRLENDFNNLTAQTNQTKNKLNRMENDFNNLTVQANHTNYKLQKMENDFNNLTAQANQTNNKLQRLETTLHNLESTMFKKSTVFNGRQYYLSLYEPHSAVNAEMACEALGGYLAEVDFKYEFDFLITLIGTPAASEVSFLLGGTDEGHEGRWVNRHSGTPLGYTSWLQGQPDNSLFHDLRENCLAMMYEATVNAFVMNDLTCFNSNGVNTFYFICEVPI